VTDPTQDTWEVEHQESAARYLILACRPSQRYRVSRVVDEAELADAIYPQYVVTYRLLEMIETLDKGQQ